MTTKLSRILLSTAAIGLISMGSAQAQNTKDFDKLQSQLEQALQLIEKQSQQVEQLSQKVQKLEGSQTTITAAPRARGSVAINTELEERITVLEDQLYEIDDKVGSDTIVNAFDAINLDIGGFFNSAYTFVNGEDGNAAAFNRQNFELLIRADLSERWSAFFVGGFLREGNVSFDDNSNGTLNEAGERRNPDFAIAPGVAGGTANPFIIGWFNYKQNDALNLRVGRLITPHGIVNIEHFPSTLLDQEQPQFLRPFGGQTIFPNFTTGAQVHGQFFHGDNSLSYNFYAASAQSAIEEPIYGGRIAYNIDDLGVTLGVNAAFGERTETVDSDYSLFGLDLLIDNGPILWKTEFFTTDEDDAPGRLAFYTQPAYRITDQWIAFYRYDFLDDGANAVAAIPDNAGDTTEHVVGINYLPIPNVRTRFTYTRREFGATGAFEEADADILQLSATYSF